MVKGAYKYSEYIKWRSKWTSLKHKIKWRSKNARSSVSLKYICFTESLMVMKVYSYLHEAQLFQGFGGISALLILQITLK